MGEAASGNQEDIYVYGQYYEYLYCAHADDAGYSHWCCKTRAQLLYIRMTRRNYG